MIYSNYKQTINQKNESNFTAISLISDFPDSRTIRPIFSRVELVRQVFQIDVIVTFNRQIVRYIVQIVQRHTEQTFERGQRPVVEFRPARFPRRIYFMIYMIDHQVGQWLNVKLLNVVKSRRIHTPAARKQASQQRNYNNFQIHILLITTTTKITINFFFPFETFEEKKRSMASFIFKNN